MCILRKFSGWGLVQLKDRGFGRSMGLTTDVTAGDYKEAFDECHNNNKEKFEFFYSAAASIQELKTLFELQIQQYYESRVGEQEGADKAKKV